VRLRGALRFSAERRPRGGCAARAGDLCQRAPGVLAPFRTDARADAARKLKIKPAKGLHSGRYSVPGPGHGRAWDPARPRLWSLSGESGGEGRMADMDAALDQYQEIETGEPFTLQGPRLLKVELSETSVMARNGSMVAYQGDVRFEHKGGGLGRLLKKAATGEQLRLMQASGSGELSSPTRPCSSTCCASTRTR
jgi:hypothetical protein